jgi:hypothetical protein
MELFRNSGTPVCTYTYLVANMHNYIYRYIFIAKTSVILAGAQASTTPDAHIKN